MRISWFDHNDTVPNDLRDEVEREIRSGLEGLSWAYALVMAGRLEMELRIKFCGPGVSWRWPGTARLHEVSAYGARVAIADLVTRLTEARPEVADRAREAA